MVHKIAHPEKILAIDGDIYIIRRNGDFEKRIICPEYDDLVSLKDISDQYPDTWYKTGITGGFA